MYRFIEVNNGQAATLHGDGSVWWFQIQVCYTMLVHETNMCYTMLVHEINSFK